MVSLELVNFYKYFLWVFALVVIIIPCERMWPLSPNRRLQNKSAVLDFFHFSWTILLAPIISAGVIFLLSRVLQTPQPLIRFQELNIYVQALILFCSNEVLFYIGHRFMHEIPFLWRFHRIHHSSQHIDWLAGFRTHILDFTAFRLIQIVFLSFFTFSAEALGLAFGLVTVVANIVHLNTSLLSKTTNRFFVTPAYHRQHHLRFNGIKAYNYALSLPLLDELLKTRYQEKQLPTDQMPQEFGLDGTASTESLKWQLLSPFMKT